jgi:hypothetical protein
LEREKNVEGNSHMKHITLFSDFNISKNNMWLNFSFEEVINLIENMNKKKTKKEKVKILTISFIGTSSTFIG